MKQTYSRLLVALAAALSLAVLAACGGGGGGGGGVETIEYTGVTTQAAITNSNAEEMATDAYLGGDAGSQMGGMFGAVGSGGQAGAPRHVAFAKMLAETVQKLDVSSTVAVGVTQSGTQPCDTSGNISFTMTVDETTGAFSGSFNYNNCTSGFQTMNGAVTFSGNMDTNGEFTGMTMTFNAVTVSDGGFSISFGGSMSMSGMLSSPVTMTMNMRIRENSTGSVVWINNYTVSIVTGSDGNGPYEEMTVSGRFYEPAHGFVDLTTIAPLRVYDVDEYPSQGELRFDGLGATYARLVVIDNTQCQVFADSDPFTPGEEFDSGVILWADL
jgi:hypothetical protein